MANKGVPASQTDRDSKDSWKFPEIPMNGEGVDEKILILYIAMNRSYKSFQL